MNYTVSAFTFEAFSVLQPSSGQGGSRFCTGSCELIAGLSLPAGAQAVSVQLDACDTDAVANVNVFLIRRGISESAFQLLASGATTGSPGCTPLSVPLGGGPHTIDNANNQYFLDVQMTGPGSTTRFTSVRVVYRLQVSPAPATATFSDVPVGSGQHRFVEALAAAGITGGCGGGLFCPDAAVTRGQMAVFLSAALGLHFPN